MKATPACLCLALQLSYYREPYYLLYKPLIMKVVGIILIIAGILMLVFRGFSFTKEEKLVDVGPLEINKKDKKSVGWPVYAGGVALVAGIIMVVADRKQS